MRSTGITLLYTNAWGTSSSDGRSYTFTEDISQGVFVMLGVLSACTLTDYTLLGNSGTYWKEYSFNNAKVGDKISVKCGAVGA